MAALAFAVAASTACAARDPGFASRFVTEGRPAIDLGGVAPASPGRTARPRGRAAEPSDVRAVGFRSSANLSTLETMVPGLQRALLLLAVAPTTDHYLGVAAAYRDAGVANRAFDYLNEGLLRDHTAPALHDALARAWRDWGFPDRGLTAAHRAVYYAPQSVEVRNTLGTMLWALGRREEARQTFADAVALDPRAWYAWRNLCEATMAAGHTREATTFCQRAASLRAAAREPSR